MCNAFDTRETVEMSGTDAPTTSLWLNCLHE